MRVSRFLALLVLVISIGHAQPAAAWIPPQADLGITKVDTPDPVLPGNRLTYYIRMMDFGPDVAAGVTLTDAIPANTTFVSLSQTSGPAFTCTTPAVGGTGVVVCSALTLGAAVSVDFTLVVKVDPNTPLGSKITNTAEVRAATADLNLGNNSATAKTDVRENVADLAVWKSGSPSPVMAGNALTYSITLMNKGPDSASGVTLTDPVPANTTFVSFGQNTGPAFTLTTPPVGATGTVTATIASLASGATATFTLVVNVDANTQLGSAVTNTVSVCSNTNDPAPGNNSASTTTKVKTSADLAVTKSDSPDPVMAGGDLTYSIAVVNNGPSAAQNVALTDAIPTNTTFVSFTQNTGPDFTLTTPPAGGTGTVSATIGTFAAGASANFTLVVNVDASTQTGSIVTNTVSVCSDTNDPVTGNNGATTTTKVKAASADLAVSKSDSPDPVTAGGDLTYLIQLTSAGPSDAQNVTLSDAIPANTTFVSLTQGSGPAFTLTTPPSGGTGTVSATIGTFPAGAGASFTLVVNVNATTADGTVITNTANVSSDTNDPAAGNNTAPTTTTVSRPPSSADLGVSKSDSPDPVAAGGDLTYSIVVVNNGPAAAQSVTLTDATPANTTFVSFTQDTGPAFTLTAPPSGGTGTVSATIDTLAPGATATFTLVVNVDETTADGTVITNTANISSDTSDPAAGNNTAPTTTTVSSPSTDIAVSKTDAPDPVGPGRDLTYSITVMNNGPLAAQNVALGDAIPANTTFVSFTQDTGPAFALVMPPVGGTGTVSATINTLAPGETATFTLVVNVDPGMPDGSLITNTATLGSSTNDSDMSNNSATTTTTVRPIDPGGG